MPDLRTNEPESPDATAERPTVLVTGATRGLGRTICETLADDHHLLVGGRDAEATTALADSLPSATPFVADVTDPSALAGAVDTVIGDGRLDAVVHNAGVIASGPVAELRTDRWREQFEVNLFSVVELTRLLLPALRRARGLVVTINSGAGFVSSAGNGSYAATKFALRAFTDALREEEREHGVRVSSIHPGRIDTDMQRQIQDHRGNMYDPSDHMTGASVAAAVRTAITLPEDAVVEMLSVRPS